VIFLFKIKNNLLVGRRIIVIARNKLLWILKSLHVQDDFEKAKILILKDSF